MLAIAQHLRFAFRQLRKAPAFSITVILTLALGIGATTAIFSLVEGVLLRPLPFRDAQRLVIVGDHLASGANTPVTAREIQTYSSATTAFSSMGGYINADYELAGGATSDPVHGARLTTGVFSTLDVPPQLGRVFTQQEEDARQRVAVISYALWVHRFGRDPDILRRSLLLDRKPYSIIGVMPRDFEFPLQPGRLNQADVWVPMSFSPDEVSDQQAGFWGYHIVARIKDGVTPQQAVQDADRVAHQVMREFPAGMSAIHIRGDATSLRDYVVADTRPLLRALFIAVSVVLLIACVNVAGLLLVRAIRRRREYAVRLALGARSSAIIGQSLFEGLILSVAGGFLGLLLAAAIIRTTLHLLPESMPLVESISIDPSVVLFAFVLAFATGVVCSLAPAFAALRTNILAGLNTGVTTSGGPSTHTTLRSALVVTEIAIALILLTASGAFLRSFHKMREVDLGFRPDHVLVAEYRLPLAQYATQPAVDTFNRAFVDRLSSKPGIVAVGITSALPSSNNSGLGTYTVEGQPEATWKLKFGGFALVSGDYFHAMSMPVLDGRTFTHDDNSDKPPVVVINQTMARQSWPGESPIGKRMHIGNPRKGYPWATVIGVVPDTKLGPRDEPSNVQFYFSMSQPAVLGGTADDKITTPGGGFVSVRSALPPRSMENTLRSTLAEIDPLLALQQVQPMDSVIENVESPRRFNTYLILAFAIGALMLAITGIYAVVAFTFSLRRREIAIRIALGAQRKRMLRLVLTSSLKLALLGCTLGAVGAFASSRLIRSFLFEVSPTDPLIYAASVLIMFLVALLAALLPAIRAASADPVDALRST